MLGASKKKPSTISRRNLLRWGAAATAFSTVRISTARAAATPVTIRYATGGGIGPNEMETIIYLDYLKKNVLKDYGKSYDLQMTFTRGTPEAATLLASGQADLGTLAFSTFAIAMSKNAVPGGLSIISDNYQDGHPGYASNTFAVLQDSPIKSVSDLKGKKVGINAYGSAVDLVLRVVLKKHGLDPRRDVQILEVNFPNMGAAIRDKRLDCGCLVIPFLAIENNKGGLRPLFTGGDAFGPSSVIFQVARTKFLEEHQDAARGFLADYVRGLGWYYDKANRKKAIEIVSAFTKSPADVLNSYFATNRDYYRDLNGCVSAGAIQKPIDAMAAEKLIPQNVDAAKYLKLGYLPKPCAT